MAVTDSEYTMVYVIKVYVVNKYGYCAITSIDDAALVRMDVLIIRRNSDDYRLLFDGGLN